MFIARCVCVYIYILLLVFSNEYLNRYLKPQTLEYPLSSLSKLLNIFYLILNKII